MENEVKGNSEQGLKASFRLIIRDKWQLLSEGKMINNKTLNLS